MVRALLVGALALAACGDDEIGGGDRCASSRDCAPGLSCIDSRCRAVPDGGGRDAEAPGDAGPRPDGAADAGADLGPCGVGMTCSDDSRCVDGRCVAWGEGAFDEACTRSAEPGPIRPQIQCVWEGPPDGDPEPTFTRVLHTPLVANLGIVLDPDVPTRPNVVFVSDGNYSEGPPRGCTAAGTLRVIDGATCRELASATGPEDRLNSPVTPAIGDLDGDGRPDVVAAHADGGVIAFRWNPGLGALERMWRGRLPDGTVDLHGSDVCMWGGVSLYDLDDDGAPEVLLDGAVWSSEGVRLGAIPGWSGFQTGNPVAVADVDGDGRAEAIAPEGVWEWDPVARSFARDASFTGPGASGYVGLADMGDFPGVAGDAPGRPEIVVSGGGVVRVLSLGGVEVFSATGGSGGGPPTVADYDGDGQPEVGAAYAMEYVVFDVGAAGGRRWAQQSQDRSSSRTGSSVFDFNGDGRAEVVYGDECYVRIYDGDGGRVLFSQARFSSTWQENPIVADVDGDSAAEMVMGMSGPCRPDYCPAVDPIFGGLGCDVAGDCPGGECVEGLCRCASDEDCGATYGCTDPLPGTAGAGQVCRAFHRECEAGLRVYRDARDRWAPSRAIWNQHAYHVTNVEDDGTIPRTSAAALNWSTPGLNNFRQNVQGDPTDVPGPDLTVGALNAGCEGEATRLTALVCNRGRALLDAGVEVIFRQTGGEELCRLRTTEPVPPGVCTEVGCVAPVQADGVFEAVVDPDEIIGECIEDNNLASGEADCLL